MSEKPSMDVVGIVLGTPDPGKLADFYHRLLGWPVKYQDPTWVMLANPGGGNGRPSLSFQLEEDHVRPVWPSGPGDQQMQVHLDIMVADLDAASAHAVAQGATVAGFQPQEGVRVHQDPDGHPFCLFLDGA